LAHNLKKININNKKSESMDLKNSIIEGVLDGKAKNIICLDLRKVNGSVSDFFIICQGDSATHIDGINRAIYKKCISNHNEKPWHQEGKGNSEWVLLDYVNVVAHIFHNDSREHYNLEGLWADAPSEVIES
jgi:ribosome-associated protein